MLATICVLGFSAIDRVWAAAMPAQVPFFGSLQGDLVLLPSPNDCPGGYAACFGRVRASVSDAEVVWTGSLLPIRAWEDKGQEGV